MEWKTMFKKSARNGVQEITGGDLTGGEVLGVKVGAGIAVAGGVTSAVANTVGDHAFLKLMVPGSPTSLGLVKTMTTAWKIAFVGKTFMYVGCGISVASFAKGFTRGFSEQWKTLSKLE